MTDRLKEWQRWLNNLTPSEKMTALYALAEHCLDIGEVKFCEDDVDVDPSEVGLYWAVTGELITKEDA